MSSGQACYNARAQTDLRWSIIASQQGLISSDAARKRARLYAIKEQLPWPIKLDPIGPSPEAPADSDAPQTSPPGVTDATADNVRTLTYYGPLITSVPELLTHCGIPYTLTDDGAISMPHWLLVSQEATAWSTPMKDVEKDLSYEDGKATGFTRQSKDARFAQNLRVFAKLVPKNPPKVTPVIHPITVPDSWTATKLSVPCQDTAPFIRTVIFSDPQFGFRRQVHDALLKPFHDRSALSCILQLCQVLRPDRIDVLGDWCDLTDFTDRFPMTPEFYFTFQPALYESFWWLMALRRTTSLMRLHEGNHDARLPKAVNAHLKFAYGLRKANVGLDAPAVLSLRNLLCLDELDIEWIDDYPNDADWLAPDLLIRHGDLTRAAPGESTRAVARKANPIHEINGHGHKRERSVAVRNYSFGRAESEAFSFGCTCRVDYTVPGHRLSQEWSQGCGVVDVYPSGEFQVTIVPIIDGRLIWHGHLIIAQDHIEHLEAMRPEWTWRPR